MVIFWLSHFYEIFFGCWSFSFSYFYFYLGSYYVLSFSLWQINDDVLKSSSSCVYVSIYYLFFYVYCSLGIIKILFRILACLVFSIFLGFVTFCFVFYVVIFRMFVSSSRFGVLLSRSYNFIKSIVSSNVGLSSLIFLFSSVLMINLIGNIPLSVIPTMYYSFTFSLRLLFWVPIMVCVSFSQLKDFLAHMLPYGSPAGLMFFLPLVEIFSQIIRPLTLIIRLSTNLSAGHIMMYMFSYFTLLSSVLSPFIYIVLSLLFVLELCISMLQAYIFVSLLSLYIRETLFTL